MKTKRVQKKTRKKSSKIPPGFKKAPQAPRRFRSPYILFSISKIQAYKRMHKNAKVTSFSSEISKEWKSISAEEKKKWKQAAEQDKLRYNAEKLSYKGPWLVSTDRPRKDPSAPKRSPSAFLNYCRNRRTELIQENPYVKNTDISKMLGMEWRSMSKELRQPHIDKEVRDRESYNQEMRKWRQKKDLEQEIETTLDMSSLLREELAKEETQTSSLLRPLRMPSQIKCTSVPPRTTRRATPPRTSSFDSDDESMNNQACPSFISLETTTSEKMDSVRPYHTKTSSKSSVGSQNSLFPTLSPAASFVIPEPTPIFPELLSHRNRQANTPLAINTDIPIPFSVPEPTPLAPGWQVPGAKCQPQTTKSSSFRT